MTEANPTMEHMFIFKYYEDLHPSIGKYRVIFVNNFNEYQYEMLNKDMYLARSEFQNQIPMCFLVELYKRREGEGNDWKFENAWQAPKSRAQATEEYYARVVKQHG
ncbi:MAG TPA: hypothetical protein VIJ87_11255 [Pyrinomonadaceae bacterium]